MFNNQGHCEPDTDMDACAPAPSCSPGHNGSDIWFSFYPSSTTATIKVSAASPMIIGIQAFAANQSSIACGSLTEIGCSLATGVANPPVVQLSGLIQGHVYYFRIYGSAPDISQMTGKFCFCGSTGIAASLLASSKTNFYLTNDEKAVHLKWNVALETDISGFDLERSPDGRTFSRIAEVAAMSGTANKYEYRDDVPFDGKMFYRLKTKNINGSIELSKIIVADNKKVLLFSLRSNSTSSLLNIEALHSTAIRIYNSTGGLIAIEKLRSGMNAIPVAQFAKGVYFIRGENATSATAFTVQ